MPAGDDPNKPKNKSIEIVVIPTQHQVNQTWLDKITLQCACIIARSSRLRTGAVRSILDELQATQNWRANFKFSSKSRIAISLKLLIKRPKLLFNLIFRARIFEIQEFETCVRHEFQQNQKKFWYSVSASRRGFPWSDDPFINSLNAIRDLENDFLIFSFLEATDTKLELPLEEATNSILRKVENHTYQVLLYPREIEPFVIHEKWSGTKLCSISEATIHNGSVLSRFGDYLPLDSSFSPRQRPARMTPCAIWNSIDHASGQESLLIPGSVYDSQIFTEGFFIDANTNYFHFLSESLRPLVMSLQSGAIPKRIFVKEDLPFQFYEIIQNLCPNAKITLLGKGTVVHVGLLNFGILTSKLSKSNEVFSRYDLAELRLGDEFKAWSYLRGYFIKEFSMNEEFFVPRRRHESRGLLNGMSVEKILSKNGYKILHAQKENFRSQVNSFSQAKTLCSTSGAGLMNMIFMPEGSRVVEIVFPFGHSWEFLTRLFNIKHSMIEVSSRMPKSLEHALDNYYLPLRNIRKELKLRG